MSNWRKEILLNLPRLRRLAVGLCRDKNQADDLVQDSVERALSKLHLFGGGDFRAWLITIMLNIFRNDRRRFGHKPVLVDVNDPAYANELIAPHIDRAASMDIRRALDRLPEDQRIAMLLLALEGLSYREIAKTQEVAIGTVMSRIGRARETLKTIMRELPAHRSGTDR